MLFRSWMMAMKATSGRTFEYFSPHWTTATTLNPSDTTRNDADAKFDTFNYFLARDIMALWPGLTTAGGCLTTAGCWCWLQNEFNVNFDTTSSSYPSRAFTASNGLYVNTVGSIPTTLINFFRTKSRYFIGDAYNFKGFNNTSATNSPVY